VVVELDGAAAHLTRRAFEDDRARDAALVARGHVVVRLTDAQVREGERALRDLRAILEIRGPA
jgi:very-short-patch-repair endonuclease